MSDTSEHDESEFYYPEEVSDAELLEQTTFIENTESPQFTFGRKHPRFHEGTATDEHCEVITAAWPL